MVSVHGGHARHKTQTQEYWDYLHSSVVCGILIYSFVLLFILCATPAQTIRSCVFCPFCAMEHIIILNAININKALSHIHVALVINDLTCTPFTTFRMWEILLHLETGTRKARVINFHFPNVSTVCYYTLFFVYVFFFNTC